MADWKGYVGTSQADNRRFSCSEKESQSNDTLPRFVEFRMCSIVIEALTQEGT